MRKVIIIGDSHSASPNSPGMMLARELQAKGLSVSVNAKGGRSALSFLRGEGGAAQLVEMAATQPDTVLVFLGTNDIFRDFAKTKVAMATLRDGFPGARVWAIGPPYWPPGTTSASSVPPLNVGAEQIVKLQRQVFTRVIDSRPLTKDIGAAGRSGTGVHFSKAGAEIWGGRLVKAVLMSGPSLLDIVLISGIVFFGLRHLHRTR